MMEDAAVVGPANPEIAQTEKIGLSDLVIAGVVALFSWVLLSVWGFPSVPPSEWTEVATASGIRPAVSVLPGYFRAIGSIVYGIFGIHRGSLMMELIGRISLGVIAVLVYAALREMLAFIMRARPQHSRRRSAVMKVASVVGAFTFIFSDRVWCAGQFFSSTTILIALTLLSIEFFFVFLRKGTLKYAYLCAIFLGLLTAETPFGLILGGVFIFVNQHVLKVMPALESPFYNPALIAVGKWYMTFLFLAALVFGIGLNCVTFVSHEGVSAIGASIDSIPYSYLVGYWERLASASDALGWILFVGITLAPFLVTIVIFPVAADEDAFLRYATGMVYLVCGVIAASQACSLSSLWYWSHCEMASSFLVAVGALFSAATLAGAVTILGVDALCRNHQRLAEQLYSVEEDDDDDDEFVKRRDFKVNSAVTTGVIRKFGMVIVPSAIILAMIPGRSMKVTREMMEVIDRTVRETVTEASGCRYIFTDGNLDVAIEIEAARRGLGLKCMNMVGADYPMDVYLRTRGLEGRNEDLFSFRHDCGMGLKSWIQDRPQCLEGVAVQVGFDIWKRRQARELPPMGGVVSLPAGWADERTRLDSIGRALDIANRALAVAGDKGKKVSGATDVKVRNAFASVLWRLAMFCTYRGEQNDNAGEANAAIAEVSMAKMLNAANEIFQRMVEVNEKRNMRLMRQLTPREGLQLALARADFVMGKTYSEVILHTEPENPDANFAMGMYYLKEKQYSRAETYLMICLVSRPDEPAIYNNLAMIQSELGKFDAADNNVEKALKLAPGSSVIKDTKKFIEKKRRDKLTQQRL